jgi:hypothetical protein
MPADMMDLNEMIASTTADVMSQFTGDTSGKPSANAPEEPEAGDDELPDTEESDVEQDDVEDDEKRLKDEETQEGDVELPEGFGMVPAITDKMVTDFTVKDAAGEDVETPALVIEYKANGKVRKDRIDQVVKLAQYGVYNQEREQSLLAKQAEMEGVVEDAKEMLTLRDEQVRRLLEDEDVYIKARERYMQENAPEKRAARAETEAHTLRRERQEELVVKQAEVFYERRVLPKLDEIAEQYPEVEMDEISAQFSAAMVPLMRNGRIPVEAYPQVEAYLEQTLQEWAERKHSARVERLSGEKKKKEEATIAAARAKRVAATATRPVVRSIPAAGDKKSAAKKNPTLDEAKDDVIDTIMSQIRSTTR